MWLISAMPPWNVLQPARPPPTTTTVAIAAGTGSRSPWRRGPACLQTRTVHTRPLEGQGPELGSESCGGALKFLSLTAHSQPFPWDPVLALGTRSGARALSCRLAQGDFLFSWASSQQHRRARAASWRGAPGWPAGAQAGAGPVPGAQAALLLLLREAALLLLRPLRGPGAPAAQARPQQPPHVADGRAGARTPETGAPRGPRLLPETLDLRAPPACSRVLVPSWLTRALWGSLPVPPTRMGWAAAFALQSPALPDTVQGLTSFRLPPARVPACAPCAWPSFDSLRFPVGQRFGEREPPAVHVWC